MTTKLRREMDNAMVLRGFAPRTRYRAAADARALSSWAAVRLRPPSRCICRALGALARQRCVRPLCLVRALQRFPTAHFQTSLSVLFVANACMHMLAHPQRHAKTIESPPRRLTIPISTARTAV